MYFLNTDFVPLKLEKSQDCVVQCVYKDVIDAQLLVSLCSRDLNPGSST